MRLHAGLLGHLKKRDVSDRNAPAVTERARTRWPESGLKVIAIREGVPAFVPIHKAQIQDFFILARACAAGPWY